MTLKAPKGGCTVRMYRHGLGDCFLLAFGTATNRQKYVLIDCGVLLGQKDAEKRITKAVQDVKDATGGHIDALVITHEHWDHISGFDQAENLFKDIAVDEVWFAWTEEPGNALARELRERRRAALRGLQAALDRGGDAHSLYGERISGVVSFFGVGLGVGGRKSTEEILDWIKQRWSKHRYCTPGGKPEKLKGLGEVSFFVLGPPQSRKFIRKSRPSRSGDQVYLDSVEEGDLGLYLSALNAGPATRRHPEGDVDLSRPFNPAYELPADSAEVGEVVGRYQGQSWRQIHNDWQEFAGELALKLDSHTNNTSLVLAIELSPGGKVLLFPGDAQVGSWLSWHDVEWPDHQADPELTASDLLARTVFYKVGHHGSHNATLKRQGLELMTSPDLTAAIPVDQETAAKQRWHMPYEPLRERLGELTQGRVILSDTDLTDDLGPDIKQTKLYVDVTLRP